MQTTGDGRCEPATFTLKHRDIDYSTIAGHYILQANVDLSTLRNTKHKHLSKTSKVCSPELDRTFTIVMSKFAEIAPVVARLSRKILT